MGPCHAPFTKAHQPGVLGNESKMAAIARSQRDELAAVTFDDYLRLRAVVDKSRGSYI